jgi:hypothetical protein
MGGNYKMHSKDIITDGLETKVEDNSNIRSFAKGFFGFAVGIPALGGLVLGASEVSHLVVADPFSPARAAIGLLMSGVGVKIMGKMLDEAATVDVAPSKVAGQFYGAASGIVMLMGVAFYDLDQQVKHDVAQYQMRLVPFDKSKKPEAPSRLPARDF